VVVPDKHSEGSAARLNSALAALPLPAAFQQAAIALRVRIRAKRKEGASYDSDLMALYGLAALHNFLRPDEYSTEIEAPSFNIAELVPQSKYGMFIMEYQKLGYNFLSMLTATDKRWLVQSWGEPASHAQMHDFFSDVYERYLNIYKKKIVDERNKGRRELRLPELTWDEIIDNTRKAIARVRAERSM
jgi:hypothetical protein